MIDKSLQGSRFLTPVLLLVFNRPELTRRVLEKLRDVRPEKLYIAADGPRDDHPADVKRCKEVREILATIDWPCDVTSLVREKNLGCKRAVSEGVSWFFDREPEGIVLEDDCLPSRSFFYFCEELLRRFRDDNRIMMISGQNRQGEWHPDQQDYFYSNLGGIWGWASWRRAWESYDGDMTHLNELIEKGWLRHLLGERTGKIREAQLLSGKKNRIDTWDYSWGYSRHIMNGLSVVPSRNLVTNIGLGRDATHTRLKDIDIPSYELHLPLRKNPIVIPDKEYDDMFFKKSALADKIPGIIKGLLKRLWFYN